MARKPKSIRDQQIYKLADYGAIVTIDYDVKKPPPFFQPAAGVVIVGQHACQPSPVFRSPDNFTTEPPREHLPARGSNLMDTESPEYQERLRMLQSGAGRVAAPGAKVEVLTSEDLFRGIGVDIPQGQTLDVDVLAAASPQKVV